MGGEERGRGGERGRTKGGERLSVKASQCSDFNGSCQARRGSPQGGVRTGNGVAKGEGDKEEEEKKSGNEE